MPDVYRPAGVDIKIDIKTPMRDGVLLSADMYKPQGQGPFPVVLNRTPYGKGTAMPIGVIYAQQGYVFFTQDVRGRYDSEGHFEPLHSAYKLRQSAHRRPNQ